ncbi:unnamed protein product [Chondrus crispus]|uniref:Uncharacterized protein n=1 Tax=Chondrus crispus TaxID=2769 RepID=R7QQ75_CHOCR|nr:unnamed protein product [Chondrus crispus]CDF39918.1 unnamed protein product [Chondrus crispus]|eukprot:XP_005710212.1 unnamed protein product [Chondrus crispus]
MKSLKSPEAKAIRRVGWFHPEGPSGIANCRHAGV